MTPIRTSAADVNYLSVSNNVWGLYEGSDHAQNLTNPPVTPLILLPTNPNAQSYAAILKICDHTSDLFLTNVQIAQGQENVVDLNNLAHSILVSGDLGYGGGAGDQVATIKGGCFDIKVAGAIYSKGRNADAVLNAWSDQSSALVSGIDLSGLARADGQPVTIILGRFGSKVDHYPASYRVLFWKSLGYKLYWEAKRAYVGVLKLLGKA